MLIESEDDDKEEKTKKKKKKSKKEESETEPEPEEEEPAEEVKHIPFPNNSYKVSNFIKSLEAFTILHTPRKQTLC